MTNSEVVEYLEKYSVAPSPSRDYYGIKVLRDQVILYTWKISHGPHINPIVRTSKFCDFSKEKTMQNEIERVFGEPTFRHVLAIAEGNENTLLTLPKHLIKKLTTYLKLQDVLKLSTLSHMAKEVFDGDIVWEVLYRREKMGLVYRDEKEKGSSYGWKRLFRERQMHKPARNRKIEKLSSDHHLVIPKYSTKISKRPLSSLPFKNLKGGTSATKLPGTELEKPKPFMAAKSNDYYNGKPDSSNRKNSKTDIKGCKSFSTKTGKSDGDSLARTNTLKTNFLHGVEVKRLEQPEKVVSTIFKSTTIGSAGKKTNPKWQVENEGCSSGKIQTLKNSGDKKRRDQTSARKNSDKKSQSSVNNSADFGVKSNFLSARVNESKVVSNTQSLPKRCEQKTSTASAKKQKDPKCSARSEICKTGQSLLGKNHDGVSLSEDFGLEELIRASITEDYLSTDNFSPHDFWQDRTVESDSRVKKISARNLSKTKNKSVIRQKFSTPRKPGAEIKSADPQLAAAQNPEIPVKKFGHVKAYLKPNGINFCGDKPYSENGTVEVKSCSSMKRTSNKSVTKYNKSRDSPKAVSCNSLDSKSISIDESSRRLATKKRGNSKK